ncbi:hypothetical protein NO1_1970, partial [Candidatus Termititenax aidoneus]
MEVNEIKFGFKNDNPKDPEIYKAFIDGKIETETETEKIYGKLKEGRAPGPHFEYDKIIQSLFDEISFAERNGNVGSSQGLLTEVETIIQLMRNDPNGKNYLSRHFLALRYAQAALTLTLAIAGNKTFTDAKDLLFQLHSDKNDPDRTKVLGNHFGNLSSEVDDTYPLSLFNHTRDQQTWFLAMALQLVERGEFTREILKFFAKIQATCWDTMKDIAQSPNVKSLSERGDHFLYAYNFYELAHKYLRIKTGDNVENTPENLYASLYNKFNDKDFIKEGVGIRDIFSDAPQLHLLELRILNDLLSIAPEKYLDTLKNVLTTAGVLTGTGVNFTLPTKKDFLAILEEIALPAYDNTNIYRLVNELSLKQVKYDTQVQYFGLYLTYLKTLGDYAALENIIRLGNSSFELATEENFTIAARLQNREGSYLSRTLAFARQEALVLSVKIGGQPALPLLNPNNLSIVPAAPAEHQRLYYLKAEMYQLLAEEARRNGDHPAEKTYRDQLTELAKAVLPDDDKAVLPSNSVYATKNSRQDKEFSQNVLCGIIENRIGQKNENSAKTAYELLKSTHTDLSKLLSTNSDPPLFTFSNLSSVQTRFLFLAAQLEDDESVRKAILERITKLYSPQKNPETLRAGRFFYNRQTTRNYWEAVAMLAEYDTAQIELIKTELARAKTNNVTDVFYIQRLYNRVYFLDVLKRLKEYKKQGE